MQEPISMPPTNSFWTKTKNFWAKTRYPDSNNIQQPTLLGHSLITGGLLTFNLVVFLLLNGFSAAKAKEWLIATSPFSMPKQSIVESPLFQARLTEQLNEIQERRERHAKVMIYFYRQYFVSLSMASGCALAAILLAFFISRDGWEKTNNGLINAFFVTFSAALLYTQIPGMFKQEINLKANRELYLAYEALGNQVLSYLATGSGAADDTGSSKIAEIEPAQFIYQVDQKLANQPDSNRV